MAVKVLIDTDIGDDVDDALALAFAARRPELDLRAVTTVYGPVDPRAQLARKLLQLLGRAEIPVAAGRRVPLGALAPERRRRLAAALPNQYPFVKPGDALPPPAGCDGLELMVKTIEAHAGDIWLVAIGPLTNVAALIRERPEVAAKLSGIACMAGETHLLRTEYNVICDPEAAHIVFRSGLVRFLGTWDVTRRVAMTGADVDALRRAGAPLAQALVEIIGLWHTVETRKRAPVMYDMCPLAWLFAPPLFTTERRAVDVELASPLTRGLTVPLPSGPLIEITTGIEEAVLLRLLMETLTAP